MIGDLLSGIGLDKLGSFGQMLIALLIGLVPALLILLAIVTPVGLLGVWAERRLSGRIQARIGPNRVGISIGPIKHHLWGLGQSVADGVKLLGKEDFVPPGGDKFMFLIAPLIVFGGSLGLFAVLPLASAFVAADPNVGVFYVLSIGAVEVIGVLMAGWASNNKWSLLGAMREVAQVVSYEIPMGIAALCPVLVVGSLKLSEIIHAQQHVNIWGWQPESIPGELFLGWNLFTAFPFNIIAFVIFYICMLANLKRAPFDLPECESELVAGFLTEYSGMRWGLFFLGEYAAMFALSGITATLFLGGWTGPLHYAAVQLGGTPGPLWSTVDGTFTVHGLAILEVVGGALEFTWKTAALFLIQMQVRWTLPRLRLDQVMSLCYRYLVPFAMVAMMFCAAAGLMGELMGYFGNVWDGIRTTAQGFKITLNYAWVNPKYTVEYPDEVLAIDKTRHRGIHEYDVDRCIACFQCSKACPVDCIYIESAPDEKGKPTKGEAAIMTRFDIDYSKCLFCALCVPPCPTECIQLGEKFSLPGHTRDEMVVHFHQGAYPIQMKTPESVTQIADFKARGLFESKRKEREAIGIPTLRPQV